MILEMPGAMKQRVRMRRPVAAVDEQIEMPPVVHIEPLARDVLDNEDAERNRFGQLERARERSPAAGRQRGDAMVSRRQARVPGSAEVATQNELGLSGEGLDGVVGDRDGGSRGRGLRGEGEAVGG